VWLLLLLLLLLQAMCTGLTSMGPGLAAAWTRKGSTSLMHTVSCDSHICNSLCIIRNRYRLGTALLIIRCTLGR
jgi:hypothetical protein